VDVSKSVCWLDDDALPPSYTSPATSRHVANTIDGAVGRPGTIVHDPQRTAKDGSSPLFIVLTMVCRRGT